MLKDNSNSLSIQTVAKTVHPPLLMPTEGMLLAFVELLFGTQLLLLDVDVLDATAAPVCPV